MFVSPKENCKKVKLKLIQFLQLLKRKLTQFYTNFQNLVTSWDELLVIKMSILFYHYIKIDNTYS